MARIGIPVKVTPSYGGSPKETTAGRYEKLARALAKEKGVSVDNEGAGVEIWTFDSGWSIDDQCHTEIPQFEDYPTESALWRHVWETLKNLQPCDADCTCDKAGTKQ